MQQRNVTSEVRISGAGIEQNGAPVHRRRRARIFEYFSRCQRARAWVAAANPRRKEIKRTLLWRPYRLNSADTRLSCRELHGCVNTGAVSGMDAVRLLD